MDLVRRWWAHRHLHRGRCANCTAVLRDDATDQYCSDACASDEVGRNAW